MRRYRQGSSHIRPRGDYYDDFCEHHPWVAGGSDALHVPYDELTEEEWREARRERKAALSRKRQPGFTAPWREQEAGTES